MDPAEEPRMDVVEGVGEDEPAHVVAGGRDPGARLRRAGRDFLPHLLGHGAPHRAAPGPFARTRSRRRARRAPRGETRPSRRGSRLAAPSGESGRRSVMASASEEGRATAQQKRGSRRRRQNVAARRIAHFAARRANRAAPWAPRRHLGGLAPERTRSTSRRSRASASRPAISRHWPCSSCCTGSSRRMAARSGRPGGNESEPVRRAGGVELKPCPHAFFAVAAVQVRGLVLPAYPQSAPERLPPGDRRDPLESRELGAVVLDLHRLGRPGGVQLGRRSPRRLDVAGARCTSCRRRRPASARRRRARRRA